MVPPGGSKTDGNQFSVLSRINESSNQVTTDTTEAHHIEFHMRASSSGQAQLSYPPTGAIPYLYDTGDLTCSGNPPEEELQVIEEIDEINDNSIEVVTKVASVSPISARQLKKEAKMLFSGSRPKGRHRA